MFIDNDLIDYIEDLSKLRLTEEEKDKAKKDLTKILTYVEKLNELDTTDVESISHPFPFTNNFRDDEIKPSLDIELVIKNAFVTKDDCFKVPKTVD